MLISSRKTLPLPGKRFMCAVQLGTHSHLRKVKHVRVKCLARGHNIERREETNMMNI